MKKLGASFALIAGLYHMLYVGGVFNAIGYQILPLQHRSVSLASLLIMSFVFFPMRKGGRTHTLTGWILGLIGAALALYPAVNYQSVADSQLLGSTTTTEQVCVLVLLVFILEASRRVLGMALPIVVAGAALHPLVMGDMPGILHAPSQSLSRIANAYFFSSDGILGTVLHVASTIIVMFVIFGILLQATGGAKFFLDLALALVGRMRGGPAKVAVVGSSLMATISGSSAANAATTGSLTIPMMKRAGYTPRFAAGVEAVASNGGQLLPPVMGVVAFLVAEFLNTSYAAVMAAGITPAIIYYLVLLAQVDMNAARRGLRPVTDVEVPRLRTAFAEGWHNLVPIAVLLYTLVALRLAPERSAFYAILALLVVSSLRRKSRVRLSELPKIGAQFPGVFLPAGIATAAAGVVMASLGLTGFGLRMSSGFVDLSGGNLIALLLLAALASFIMGMGMSSVPVYVILAATVAPNLVSLGVEPMAAHLFVFWWGVTSFITPPICITVYVTASLAGAHPIKAGFTAVKLGIANYVVPFVFVLEPALLFLDGWSMTFVVTALSALAGAVLIAAAFEGYLFGVIMSWARVAFGVFGVLLLFPATVGEIVGLVGAVTMLILIRLGIGKRPDAEASAGMAEPHVATLGVPTTTGNGKLSKPMADSRRGGRPAERDVDTTDE